MSETIPKRIRAGQLLAWCGLLLALFTLLTGTTVTAAEPAVAADASADTTPASPTATGTAPASESPAPSTSTSSAPAGDFRPSEEISEDFAVSFPVDI